MIFDSARCIDYFIQFTLFILSKKINPYYIGFDLKANTRDKKSISSNYFSRIQQITLLIFSILFKIKDHQFQNFDNFI